MLHSAAMSPVLLPYRNLMKPDARRTQLMTISWPPCIFQFVLTLALVLIVAIVSAYHPDNPLLKHDSIHAQSAFVPVCDRTPAIRDAIVEAARVDDCGLVTQAQVNALTEISYYAPDLTADHLILKTSDFSGLGNLTTLRVTASNLRKLTRGLFKQMPNLTALTLTNNAINEIEPGSFEGLEQLATLFLDGNRLEELDERAFQGLGASLSEIVLSVNQLTTLKTGTFRGLSGLTWIDLSANELTSLEDGIFGDADQLVTLHIHNNRLKSFPAGTLPMTIKNLYFYGNSELDTLPEFASGTQLTSLLMSEAIEVIPQNVIDAIQSVQFLLLPRELSAWPTGFSLPSTLVYLYVQGNAKFTTLPGNVFTDPLPSNLIYLFVFDLGLSTPQFNAIKAKSFRGGRFVTNGIGLDGVKLNELITNWCGGNPANCPLSNWTGPAWLYLYDDDLSGWDQSSVPALANVQRLLLHNNMMSAQQIADLLSNMCVAGNVGCDNLTNLSLSQENLDGFVMEDGTPLNKFSRLTSLTVMDSGIGSETAKRILKSLENSNGLQDINLNGNKIASLPRRLSEVCNPHLSSVRLKGNRIQQLDPGFFVNTYNLQTIDLGDNRLTEFPADIFDGEDNDCNRPKEPLKSSILRVLYLDYNQLSSLPLDANGKYFGKHRRLETLDLTANYQFEVEQEDFVYLTKQIRISLPPPLPKAPAHVSAARILRIVPSITSLTLKAGDEVRLAVNVYGRQDILDNALADVGADGSKPTFEWSDGGNGSFSEAVTGVGTQYREVVYTAPSRPGAYTVTVSLPIGSVCLSVRTKLDETDEEADARCNATFEVNVLRSTSTSRVEEVPVNPSGPIPLTITDSDGVANAVITPVEGGTFVGEGISISAGPGAVTNHEVIGVNIADAGDASNVGQTHHRYALAGRRYNVGVVDFVGETIARYTLKSSVEVCVPMPAALRSKISDVALTAINSRGSLTILATNIKITAQGMIVCGALSELPSTVAVGSTGAPSDFPTPTPVPDAEPPDTGGRAPAGSPLILFVIIGAATIAVGRYFALKGRRVPSL